MLYRNMGSILSLVLAVTLFVTALIWSFDIPVTQKTSEVGPRFFPLVGAIVGLYFCGVLLLQLIRRKSKPNPGETIPLSAVKVGLSIAAYVFLIPSLGFYISSAVSIPLLMWLGGERRRLLMMLTVLGFCLFTYFLFEVSLNIEFPKGVWND